VVQRGVAWRGVAWRGVAWRDCGEVCVKGTSLFEFAKQFCRRIIIIIIIAVTIITQAGLSLSVQ